MKLRILRQSIAGLLLALLLPAIAWAQAAPLAFNVLNQRSVQLTTAYWEPILAYVSKKSGVPLELKLANSARAANQIGEKGGYDFMYTNHFFTPEREGIFQQ
ncbi:MAG: phosphate/phosphite/phosphonate ABC transporter substrate-binding protein [Betaproteobacteria bacterium]|nr:phosphate/phosphite/phosphonate ABC transporter substrate-binding protein [Betaproteobacteria bacterium]